MVTIDQELWNILFGWLGPECMLPEGCNLPLVSVLIVLAAALAVVLSFYRRRALMEKIDALIGSLRKKL
jgi:hypothetical protein